MGILLSEGLNRVSDHVLTWLLCNYKVDVLLKDLPKHRFICELLPVVIAALATDKLDVEDKPYKII